ncbi:MAG: NAD-dependent deacylase [Chitinophagales bacterium]|nr:NAD-dependent deacylase [Chitinophagales bacterium]
MKRNRIAVLTGAGISAESGLQTFRDSDGLWENYRIEDVATPSAWKKDPRLVLEFYNSRRRNVAQAKPNAAHYGLAELEKDHDVIIITQNIDDLHERAGSTQVIHLHGEIFKMCSERDKSLVREIRGDISTGDLAEDGAQYRPFIVWFGEPVPKIEEAMIEISLADIFVIVGTSLLVYPAAGLTEYARADIPKFIIDKRIPYTSRIPNLTAIEKPATEGVEDLKKLLAQL